jgi:hypothetical protein
MMNSSRHGAGIVLFHTIYHLAIVSRMHAQAFNVWWLFKLMLLKS